MSWEDDDLERCFDEPCFADCDCEDDCPCEEYDEGDTDPDEDVDEESMYLECQECSGNWYECGCN